MGECVYDKDKKAHQDLIYKISFLDELLGLLRASYADWWGPSFATFSATHSERCARFGGLDTSFFDLSEVPRAEDVADSAWMLTFNKAQALHHDIFSTPESIAAHRVYLERVYYERRQKQE